MLNIGMQLHRVIVYSFIPFHKGPLNVPVKKMVPRKAQNSLTSWSTEIKEFMENLVHIKVRNNIQAWSIQMFREPLKTWST